MYRIMNKGTPNNRSHIVSTDEVIKGGRLISKTVKTNGLTRIGNTAIDPDGKIVHVTDALGKILEKHAEILIVEKVSDSKEKD